MIAYNPSSGQAKTLLDELYFANGVAISKNEDFVLINETYRYRIIRYWLKGPLQGQADIFIDNLPGLDADKLDIQHITRHIGGIIRSLNGDP